MTEQQLHHIYQAWSQGNDHYVRDWSYFVEYAASKMNTTGDKIMNILQTCSWFQYPQEER